MNLLDRQRKAEKKELDQLSGKVARLENHLQYLASQADSPALSEQEAKRKEAFDRLEVVDLKLREVQEDYLVKIMREGLSRVEAFNNLPKDLIKLYEEMESVSKAYQAVLREGETLLEVEALKGQLGEEVLAMAQELYGPEGLRAQLSQANLSYSKLVYEQMASLKEKQIELERDYVEKILPDYFYSKSVKIWELLDGTIESLQKVREVFIYAEKAWSYWDGNVISGKPKEEKTSLY